MQERLAPALSGWAMLVFDLLLWIAVVVTFNAGISSYEPFVVASDGVLWWSLAGLLFLLSIVVVTGFVVIRPNHARVLTFVGRYVGTIRRTGFSWTYPLTNKSRISLRIQNFDSQTLKVNDAVGNPIEVAAVIVWRVVDTAKAEFEIEDYEEFVKIQTETAVRHMASEYPYDTYVDGMHSLRANADEVTDSLHRELQGQLEQAGVEVLRTQLRRLAYAPEIAADMLRRQQAEAVVAARTRIVEGAVGMVDHALQMLSQQGIVEFDNEKKAAMVSNLLVVLCSEHHAQPVVNAGSLYQ
jgi:regulator of protease activity HflC (stomatin/prohibitin superfamily)